MYSSISRNPHKSTQNRVATIVLAAYAVDFYNSLPCLAGAADFFADPALDKLIQSSIRDIFLKQVILYGHFFLTISISVSGSK